MPEQTYLGIDWGTHSSKWVFAHENQVQFKILRSEVRSEGGDERLFLAAEPPARGSVSALQPILPKALLLLSK